MISVCLAAAAAGQTTGGVQGWIVDSSNVPLPGVTVEATGASLQGRRAAVTGKDGTYRLAGLPPGPYKIAASLPGFASFERTVDVTLDATTSVKLILQLSLNEQVVVTATEASGEALIDTSSTTTGTTYRCGVVVHLPVDRNYADIVKANPGVAVDRGNTQGRSLALAVNGSTSAENGWVIDGINTVNVLKGIQGKAINTEFIQEIEVKTGGYQAEYGRSLGGVINVITKSGSNTLHGDGFLYYDTSSLEAQRVFVEGVDSPASGMRIVDFRRTDYGLDLGGPILTDRLWFFGAYNRVDFPAEISRFEDAPLVPASMRFPLDGIDNLFSGKLTWSPSSGTTIVGTVFGDPTTNTGAGAADPRQGTAVLFPITNPQEATWGAARKIGGTDFGLRASQVLSSSGLATLEAARHRDSYLLTPTSNLPQIKDFTCDGGTPTNPCTIPGNPNFVEGGFGPFQAFPTIGPDTNDSSRRDQIRGDLSLYTGAHDLKLGGDYQYARTAAFAAFSGGQRVSRFDELGQTYYEHDFFAKSPTDLTVVDKGLFVGQAREVGLFIQDSWKTLPGLTVNAGLRWDHEDLIDYAGVTQVRLGREWQPRLGIVWDPGRDGATRVYAFAGRFYYSTPLELVARVWDNNTLVQTFNEDPVDVTNDPNLFGDAMAHSGSGELVDTGMKGTWLDEYTLGVEKALGTSLTVGLRGTYRTLRGAIEDRCDLDYTDPRTNGGTCALTQSGGSGAVARGDIAGCNGLDPVAYQCGIDPIPPVPRAKRIYRGLELLVRENVSTRLWLQASYVYSSLRGNYDGAVSEGFGGQTSPGINADFDYYLFSTHNNHGRLYLDRPNSFRLDGFYLTPWNVSVGLQAYARSGAPLDKRGYFNWQYQGVIQLVPRGYAGRLPTEWEANLTLEYPLQLGPVTVTLQAYLYNLFNNQIPTLRDVAWSNSQPPDYPASLYDSNQNQTNPNYGLVTQRQDGRLFRAALRVSF